MIAVLIDHRVVGIGGVVRRRNVHELKAIALPELRGKHPDHVFGIPQHSHFLFGRLFNFLFKRCTADKVVVEFHDMAVADVHRGQIPIFDIIGDKTTPQRSIGFKTIGRQPFAVGFHIVAGIDGGELRRHPTRLMGDGGIRFSTAFQQSQVFTGGKNSRFDFVFLRKRPHQLQARSAGHAVAQSSDLTAANFDFAHVEELYVGKLAAAGAGQDVHGVRALHLIAILFALPGQVGSRAVIDVHLDVVAAGFGMVLNPIPGIRAVYNAEQIVCKGKQNRVADHVAAVVADDDLFGLIASETLVGVDR